MSALPTHIVAALGFHGISNKRHDLAEDGKEANMQWKWLAACIGFGLIISLSLGMQQVAARPRTYEAAVMQVLDQRHIVYRAVQVHDACPPAAQWWGASRADASVHARVIVHAMQTTVGSIEYRHSERHCRLTLAAFELYAMPIPTLAHDPDWLRSLRRYQHLLRDFRINNCSIGEVWRGRRPLQTPPSAN